MNCSTNFVMQLTVDAYLSISTNIQVEDWCLCHCAALTLQHPNLHDFEITPSSGSNTIFDILTSLRAGFEAALNGNLVLPALPHDLGYLRCEKFHTPHQERTQLHKMIGQYLLIDTPAPISTWLYERDGQFFFEVTPLYPWEFRDPEPHEQYCSYEEFMASYAPLLTIPLERQTIEKLHKQVAKQADAMLAREYSLHAAMQESHDH